MAEQERRIRLNFVDELTERSISLEVSENLRIRDVWYELQKQGFYPDRCPSGRIRELEWFPQSAKVKQTRVGNGHTLHVAFDGTGGLQGSERALFFRKYTVVARFRENAGIPVQNVYTCETIECYGFDTKSSIEWMLGEKRSASAFQHQIVSILESSWPLYREVSGRFRKNIYFLCQLSPDQTVHLDAEDRGTERRLMVELYGCPRAAEVPGIDTAAGCNVEIVTYE